MCPACMASAALMMAGVVSTGGLTALAAKLRGRKSAKKGLQGVNPKEEA
jgi:hypothetical protein